MKPRTTLISTSLTILNEIDVEYAVDMFECLLKAAGTIESSEHYLYELSRMVEIIFDRNNDIR